jgi:Holliday junction resolvase RusA-like endonuclease
MRRPRIGKKGQHSFMFMDRKTSEEIRIVKQHASEIWNHSPIQGPVKVEIEAAFPCPKSAYRVKNPAKAQHKDSKPDIDNIAKFYLDALCNGLVVEDDCQVISLSIGKHRLAQGEDAYTKVKITKVTT